jgi:ParB family transcriptional regulator, chromosome partitioning protein
MTDPKHKRRNALGRGLSALLSDSEESNNTHEPEVIVQNEPARHVSEISIDSIETNPYQPRTHFDLVALEELSHSIQVQGIIQPITVRSMGVDTYQLISGERRLQASKMAGLKRIPAYVRTADDEQMLEMALIENIQRQDLNPMEIALAYQRLVEELNLKLEDLGDKVGKKRATVNNYLRLLKLPPEIQIGLKEAKLSMGHARALINIENVDDQLTVYRAILEGDLSVRKVEEMVRALAERSAKKPSSKPSAAKDIHIQRLERKLEEKFGSRVAISQSGQGRGELKIGFESTEDLNRILEILEP